MRAGRSDGEEGKGLAVRNDPEEFIRLAAPYEKTLYLTCLALLSQREDAEDALQETMLKAYRAWPKFRREAKISTWLKRIAVNVSVDMLRKRKPSVSVETMREAGQDLPDLAAGPYERLEKAERKRILYEALSLMDEEQRKLIVLRDVQGLSYEEISQTLDRPLGTVKSGLSRAREKLNRLLKIQPELFENGPRPERRTTA